MQKVQRYEAADIFKGLLIIFVLFGHSLSMINSIRNITWDGSPVNVFLTSFNMPAFAVISGYFIYGSLSRKGPLAVAKARMTKLIPILFIWCVIPFLVLLFVQKEYSSLPQLLRGLYNAAFEGKLWYIASYLVCSLIACVVFGLEKATKSNRFIRIICLLGMLAFMHFSPLSLGKTTFLLSFFMLGYYVNEQGVLENSGFRKAITVAGMLFPIALFLYGPEISFYSYSQYFPENHSYSSVLIYIYRFLCALCGCCFFFSVSVGLKRLGRVKSVITEIGKSSLQIYILSMYLQEALILLFRLVIPAEYLNDMNTVFSVGPVFFVILLALSYYGKKLINRIPVVSKYLIGE